MRSKGLTSSTGCKGRQAGCSSGDMLSGVLPQGKYVQQGLNQRQ